jgi:chromosome 3 open reading frame 10
MSSNTPVQSDWSNRENTEIIKTQILKMTEFLHKFNLSTRNRLSLINERLTSLERSLTNVESAIKSTNA